MATQFGSTWWSQAYLGALTQIDWENRLGRGKSYARGERIQDIHINENIVKALVQGRLPKPYKVQLVHIPLLPGDQKKITNALAKRPDLISDILNARLPEELNEICKKEGVKIFPQSWRDIKLNCNCPDWAVPCKHIAAVIYTLANEIDKDPFLVFKLLKFDLVKAFQAKGIEIKSGDEDHIIPSTETWLSAEELERGAPPFDQEIYSRIDLTAIPFMGTDIPQFLEARPVFYHEGDFRVVLELWVDDMKVSLERELKDIEDEIKLKKAEARKLVDLHQKVAAQRIIKDLEKEKSEKRKKLFLAQDEIDSEKEKLISGIESKLQQKTERKPLFTLRWNII